MAEALLDPLRSHEHAAAVEARARRLFQPRPTLTHREWGELYRKLGDTPLRFDRTPYLIEIIDAFSDPAVEEMAIGKCTQSGGTDALWLTIIGYHVDIDPVDMLICLPSIDEAEKWSKKKLVRMMESTPSLRGKIKDARSRDGSNTILEKSFPGGSLGLVGSNSGRGFRMVTIDLAGGDDVDGWAASAGPEGDQITLLYRRVERSHRRKLLWISTPTTEHGSKIKRLYEKMDRRGRFAVPCPHCGEYQVLRWGGPDTPFGIKWENNDPETAYYLCAANGCVIEHAAKYEIVPRGMYLTDEGEPIGRAKRLGFWFNALTVTLVGSEWSKLVDEWLDVHKDPVALRGFVNGVLAETWEEKNSEIDPDSLQARAELFEAEVPRDVGALTAGVDVQENRLELLVVGWGAGEESWHITHQRLWGDPERSQVWADLERWLVRAYQHEGGATLRIERCMIDAGYLPDHVYRFARSREKRGVYASIGTEGREAAAKLLTRSVKKDRHRIRRWRIGTSGFKDILFKRLAQRRLGAGYMHFPDPNEGGTLQDDAGGDAEYFKQFTGEVLEIGRGGRRYKQVGRNESIDLWVYATAALYTRGAAFRAALGDLVDKVKDAGREGRSVTARGRQRVRVISRGIE